MSVADDRKTTNDNGGGDIARTITGIKKNISTGIIVKGRINYQKKIRIIRC